MKKLFVILALVFCSCMFFLPIQIIQAEAVQSYATLSPLPGLGSRVNTTDFPAYLQAIYKIGIGLCFVLGVIMFTWAGIEYIISESMSGKGDAKKRITAALTGLAIALVSYILLYTINPDLLQLKDLNIQPDGTKTAPGTQTSDTPGIVPSPNVG